MEHEDLQETTHLSIMSRSMRASKTGLMEQATKNSIVLQLKITHTEGFNLIEESFVGA